MDGSEKNKVLFAQLIVMLHGAAMQQMGKIKNPISDKIERDLAQAQLSIDMIDMIQEKTRGNLSSEEDRFLQSLLQELKLNYVDEVRKDQQTQPQQESQTKSTQ
jgi:enterochelin esterase-like enzyme